MDLEGLKFNQRSGVQFERQRNVIYSSSKQL